MSLQLFLQEPRGKHTGHRPRRGVRRGTAELRNPTQTQERTTMCNFVLPFPPSSVEGRQGRHSAGVPPAERLALSQRQAAKRVRLTTLTLCTVTRVICFFSAFIFSPAASFPALQRVGPPRREAARCSPSAAAVHAAYGMKSKVPHASSLPRPVHCI